MAEVRTHRALGRLLLREARRMMTQPGYAFLLFGAPLLAWALLNGIVATPKVRDVPFQVVDLDQTPASRDLAFRLDASPTLDVTVQHEGTDRALAAVRDQSIFGYLVIESGFSEHLKHGESQTVPAYVNQQSYMMGTLLSNQLVRFIIERSLRETASLFVVKGELKEQALAQVIPIQTRRAVFGNQWLNYQSFLLGALQTHIWHVVVVLVTLVTLGQEFRDGTLSEWWGLAGERMAPALFGKLLWPTLILFGWALLGQMRTLHALALPWSGYLGPLAIASLTVQLFYQTAALLVVAWLHNLRKSLSVAAVYTLPAFAFIGVTFPVANMNQPAQIWQHLLPVGTLVRIQDGVIHTHWSLTTVLETVRPIALATLALLPPGLWILRSKMNRPELEGHT